MTKKASTISAYISLFVIPFGAATGGLAYKVSHVKAAGTQVNTVDASQEADAPFRDGFYLGGLDAKASRTAHPSIGRWNDPKDRGSFVAGYQRGYEQTRSTQITEHRQ